MPDQSTSDTSPDDELLEIDLRSPGTAALLAWLWPGAGHFYQRRYAKAMLFMVCILGTYFYGLFLGNGHVVYASWKKQDRRWQYVCQLGVGMPAFPAMVQSYLVKSGRKPLMVMHYRSPHTLEIINDDNINDNDFVLYDAFMAPPFSPVEQENRDALAVWHEELHAFFELGTLFTVVAGLLNILAIYDAYAGPMLPETEDEKLAENESKTK